MGKYIHVVKRQPEYGDTRAFNWKQEEFKSLLNALAADVQETDEFSDNFECEKHKYERAIEILKRFKKDGKDAKLSDLPISEFENGLYTEDEEISDITEFVDLDDVEDCLIKLTYEDDNDDKDGEIDKIIKVMQDLLEEADPNSSWISFSAW